MKKSVITNALCWGVVACVACALIVYGYTSASYHRAHAIGADGCLSYLPAPAVLVVADDITDRLEGDQPRHWRSSVEAEISRMPPGTKLLFTQIGANVPSEILFDKAPCVPPPGTSLRIRNLRQAMSAALDRAEILLRTAQTTKQSPIRRTLIAIAADPVLQGARKREILMESDLLELDGTVSAYRRKGLELPSLSGLPLKNVAIHFSVLQNQRDARFQTRQLVQSWSAWAAKAGGNVSVDAAWMGIVSSDQGSSAGLVR